ncbi:MAG: glycosyltransferase 2 family protein [Bacillota bacterium]|nr:glycosyltransferase 2 family protein [Bacillota bacterium]MDK2882915.1 glycosyltransferase 2 family protein [Bacillota bacterium]
MLLGGVISVALSAGSLAYIFFRLPGDTFPLTQGLVRPARVLLALFLLVLAWLSDALRLKFLARALNKRLPLTTGLRAILVGNFVTSVTPFLFGGAPAVVYILTQAGLSWTGASAVVVAGGWVAQGTLAVLSLLAVFALRLMRLPLPLPGLFVAGISVYVLVLTIAGFLVLRPELAELALWLVPGRLRPRVRHGLRRFQEHMEQLFTSSPRWLLLSFGCAALYFLLFFAIAPALLAPEGPALTWLALAALQDAAYLVAAFAPTPGGSGASEFGILYIFRRVLPFPLVKEYILWWRLLTFYLNLFAGGIALSLSTWRLFASRQKSSGNA